MPSSPSSKGVQVYVAGFSRRTNRDDLKDLFRKFGKIRDIILKERYAFLVKNLFIFLFIKLGI